MDAQDEEICHIILRLLYPRAELMESPEPISVHDLSVAIDSDEDRVKANLIDLQRRGLVAIKEGGVILTEKTVWAIRQNERSYCPYL
jgi:Mn-dependent DtxR family transcriptional regulator